MLFIIMMGCMFGLGETNALDDLIFSALFFHLLTKTGKFSANYAL